MKTKRKLSKYFWLLLLLSAFPLLAIFLNSLMIHTHDGPVHLARMAAWYKAFQDGQIPPRWAADLNYGYGTPVLIFMYPFPYFLGAVFLSLGFGLVWSFKLILALSYLLSGIFMFFFVNKLLQDEKKAFLISLLYQFASFRLVEIIIRGALGEVWTYTFVPLALLGLVTIFSGRKLVGFLLTGLGTGLLILSHNSVSLSFFMILVLFVLFFGKSLAHYLWGFVSLGLGIGLSAFYWLPALWERKYTYGDLFMKDLYLEHFPSLKQLFLPNFLNQSWGWINDIAVQFGMIHVLALIIGVFLLFKKKLKNTEKRIIIFSLVIFFGCLFFMQPFSIPLWKKISLLRQFQFSWRLLALVTLATSLAGVSLFSNSFLKNKRIYWLLVSLILLFSLSYWQPILGFDQINERDYWYYPLSTTYFGEADTIWAAGPPKEYPEKRVEIIGGEGEISEFFRNSISQKFLIKADSEVNVLSQTTFFPGWRILVNNQQIPIEFQDQNHRGLITFRLPEGEHQVEINFGRTKDRSVAEIISLGCAALFFVLTILVFLQKHRRLTDFRRR